MPDRCLRRLRQADSRRFLTLVGCSVAFATVTLPVLAPVAPAVAARGLGDRVLRPGDQGKDVKELQQLLVGVGIATPVDGDFGPATERAVKRFQRSQHYKPSGTIGKKTIAALRAAANGGDTKGASSDRSSRSLGDRLPLREGMTGHDVKILQDFLTRAGFEVTIDSEFGPGTAAALERFEAANKLPVDGIVDEQDVKLLRGQAASDDATDAPPVELGPGSRATVGSDGLATAPASAPEAVKQMIAAGNRIAKHPYIYGGGHANFPEDKGYDCSGSMSYVLWGAKLLRAPLVSSDFPNWGEAGPGKWVTLYGNSGHAYMVIAGLRFDTSGAKQDGSRWHKSSRSTSEYGVSHPAGL